MSQPVLSLPKREGKFQVETDTSGHAIGGVLSQEQEGKWKPIAFLSRTMQPVKRNYEIYDKELLAIVKALTKWRQYLLDTMEPFEVWTDHKRNTYKNVSSANKIKFSIRRRWESYIHQRYLKNHGKKLVSTSLDLCLG